MSQQPSRKPQWQLPQGVTTGISDYVQSDSVAADYDQYFAGHSLMAFDEPFVCETLADTGEPGQLVADLGCGTGRVLIALAEQGFRGLAIDLSEKMLQQVRSKAQQQQLPIETLQANWVELDQVEDGSVDHAVSLFSTLGMIRGANNRRAALRHTARILKPGGLFVLHVHNFWFNLYDVGGPWWVLKSLAKGAIRKDWERGDKYYAYRGVPNMFLHVFSRREIRQLVHSAGFHVQRILPLRLADHRPLSVPWLFPSLRAVGWIVVAAKRELP